jgi:hypothetical protein
MFKERDLDQPFRVERRKADSDPSQIAEVSVRFKAAFLV